MISVLILTKNEELDIGECLKSVSWCDDIHILDSFSEDNTVKIATEHRAQVTQRPFEDYASQRNAGLNELPFKYSWILTLDADERVPEILVIEMKSHLQNCDDKICGFRIRRRDFLDNKWLKYSQLSPFYIRLIRKGKARYHREINEVLVVDGLVRDIDCYFDHYPFSKGLNHWVSKHNQYSAMEAKRWIEESKGNMNFSISKAFLSKDFNEKRYHQKGLYYKLPGRPILKWMYMMFWRFSFLDGRAGFKYAALQSFYEYLIVLKTRELLVGAKQICTDSRKNSQP